MGVMETYESFDPVARDWDDLAERTNAPPFLRPGWMQAWWSAFGTGSLEVVTVRRDGRMAGIVPLRARGKVLESATNWHTPEFGVVAEDEGTVAELMTAVFARRPRRASLMFLRTGEPEVNAYLAAAAAVRYRATVNPLERPPFVSMDSDWDAFESSLPSKLRGDLRRRRRLLEKEGSVTVEVSDGREDLARLLDEGFGIEGSGWKNEAGTAIVSQVDTLQFYTDAARWAAEQGWLRLAFLRLDGRPIAFEYGLEHAGVYYLLKGGYDPAYKRFAPSRLLIREMLERGFSQGLKRFDFGGTEESFKLEWANGRRELVHLQGFARSPLGQLDWMALPLRRYGPVALSRLKSTIGR